MSLGQNHSSVELYNVSQKLAYTALYSLYGTKLKAERAALSNGMEFDDFLQIARISLWKCCLNHTEREDSTFQNYAIVSMKKAIMTEVRRRGALIRIPENKRMEIERYDLMSFDVPLIESDETLYSIVPSLFNVEYAVLRKLELEERLNGLSLIQRKTLTLKLQGFTDAEIAQQLQTTKKTISMSAYKAIQKLSPGVKRMRKLSKEFAELYEKGLSKDEIMKNLQIDAPAYRNYKYSYKKRIG